MNYVEWICSREIETSLPTEIVIDKADTEKSITKHKSLARHSTVNIGI